MNSLKTSDEDVETVDELKEKVRKELEENKNSAANRCKR